MKLLSPGFVLILILVSQLAVAESIPRTRTVTAIHTYNDWAAIRFDPPYDNSLGCLGDSVAVDTSVVIDWGTDSERKAMFASVLAAYMGAKQIGFGINVCSPKFGGGVPLVYRVDLGD